MTILFTSDFMKKVWRQAKILVEVSKNEIDLKTAYRKSLKVFIIEVQAEVNKINEEKEEKRQVRDLIINEIDNPYLYNDDIILSKLDFKNIQINVSNLGIRYINHWNHRLTYGEVLDQLVNNYLKLKEGGFIK